MPLLLPDWGGRREMQDRKMRDQSISIRTVSKVIGFRVRDRVYVGAVLIL